MTLPATLFGPDGGVPLVALHGFLGRGADWADLARRLPGVRLLAPDLPGHGAALGLADAAFSMEAAAAAVLATLDAHRLDRPVLLGYSMGGRLALYLALHAPEHFRAVVLESASPGLTSEAERADRRRLDDTRADALARDLPGFLDRWYAMPLFAATPAPVRKRLAATRVHNSPADLARSLRFMGTGAQPDLWPLLPRLAVPVTAVAGSSDAKFVALARAMTEASARIHPAVVAGAGHTVHLDAPDAFAALVAGVLGVTPPPARG